jgi:hypothetical protein
VSYQRGPINRDQLLNFSQASSRDGGYPSRTILVDFQPGAGDGVHWNPERKERGCPVAPERHSGGAPIPGH